MQRESTEERWGLSLAGTAGLERARAGDVDAFGIVCQELEEALWRHGLMLCGDQTMTEDLVQEALITAWRRLDRFDGTCRFRTWVTGILLNLHRNLAKKKQPVLESQLQEQEANGSDLEEPDSDSPLSRVADCSQGPADEVLLLERAGLIRKCLDNLPEEQRDVVQLRFYAGAQLAEIAAVLGCPEGTVKSRLFQAIRKLTAMPEMRSVLLGNTLEK